MIAETFIENVERQLARKKWSRSEFARQLEVTPGYVTNILNRRNDPGLNVVERWCEVLGVSVPTMFRQVSQK